MKIFYKIHILQEKFNRLEPKWKNQKKKNQDCPYLMTPSWMEEHCFNLMKLFKSQILFKVKLSPLSLPQIRD